MIIKKIGAIFNTEKIKQKSSKKIDKIIKKIYIALNITYRNKIKTVLTQIVEVIFIKVILLDYCMKCEIKKLNKTTACFEKYRPCIIQIFGIEGEDVGAFSFKLPEQIGRLGWHIAFYNYSCQ